MELRALEPEDLPQLRALASRPEIEAELDVALQELETWCEPAPLRAAIGAFEGVRLIGAAVLNAYERVRMRHVARVQFVAGPDAAPQLSSALRDLARDWWKLDRVELSLPEGSQLEGATAAAQMLREVVRRRDFDRGGARVDSIGYAWVRPDAEMRDARREFPRPDRAPLPADFTIRETRPEDAPAFTAILADPRVLWGTLQPPYVPVAFWRKRLATNDPTRNASFVALAGGELIGSCGLHGAPSPRRQHVWSLGMSVHGDWQGRGVGQRMMEHLMRMAEERRIERVELEVYTDNSRAIALYEKLGFVREGIHRAQSWRAGEYADTLVMAKLR